MACARAEPGGMAERDWFTVALHWMNGIDAPDPGRSRETAMMYQNFASGICS
jgi:hypothetical protein